MESIDILPTPLRRQLRARLSATGAEGAGPCPRSSRRSVPPGGQRMGQSGRTLEDHSEVALSSAVTFQSASALTHRHVAPASEMCVCPQTSGRLAEAARVGQREGEGPGGQARVAAARRGRRGAGGRGGQGFDGVFPLGVLPCAICWSDPALRRPESRSVYGVDSVAASDKSFCL